MILRISTILVVLLLLMGCSSQEKKRNLENFAGEFSKIKTKFDAELHNTESNEQLTDIKKRRREELKALLEKYDPITTGEKAELLKSNLLIALERFPEANQKLDKLIANKDSKVITEAQMAKVKIHILYRETAKALQLFRAIEGKMKRGPDLWSTYYYFTHTATDDAITKEYGQKFLEADINDDNLANLSTDVYLHLANAAIRGKELKEAKTFMEQALANAPDRKHHSLFQAKIKQLELPDKPALPLKADTWINSNPLNSNNLKGKTTILYFWAPWCETCRANLNKLEKIHLEYKTKGLTIIGITRLYGKYSDETGSKGTVDTPTEIKSITDFTKQHNLTFPIAIDNEGIQAANYHVTALPTMVLIDKKGNVDHVCEDTLNHSFIKTKIKTLTEAK